MEAQANAPKSSGGKIWLRSIAERDLGRDVAQMVADVRQKETTGHVRKRANAGKRKTDRYVENTMGYQVLDK